MSPRAELEIPVGATLDLRYDASVAALSPLLRERFVPLARDAATDEFLSRAVHRPHPWWRVQMHRFVRLFMSDFDANGLLDMYPLHVGSSEQWRKLLGSRRIARLLDVGAGSGNVTRTLAPLADTVVTTELSRHMAERLRRSGFECHELDLAQRDVPGARFDLVCCLNVLDRTSHPLRLLRRLEAALEPGGRLMIALALPYDPFYCDGASTPQPSERLSCSEPDWESAVSSFVAHDLLPLGLSLLAVSRVPYLSFGDSERSLYELDDALVLLEKPA